MNIIAVYPGRFQPFHKGHAQVYQWLKNKFGNCHIATTSKVEAPKSPFNFAEKKKMMELAGVSPSDIIEVRNPYLAPEILRRYDGKKTVLVFAVSEKDMTEDPRFSFKPKKDGSPGYLQPFPKNEKDLKPFGDPERPTGYVVVTPTFQFKVLGQPMQSASELRKQFVESDNEKQKAIVKDLFGKYDASVHKLMDEKIKGMASQPVTLKAIRKKALAEQLDHDTFGPMLDTFVQFASDKLGLKSQPSMKLSKDGIGTSFGGYNPAENSIVVVTKNRHPMDVFRTVAHELVHHKQNEEGRIKDVAKEGSTGSDIENEANSEAGKIMRWFAKANPNMFKSSYITEDTLNEGINDPSKFKAVFLAGGPGSGKDFVLKQTLHGHGLQEINSDIAFEFLLKKKGLSLTMPDSERATRDKVRGEGKNITKEQQRLAIAGRRGVIINGTADDPEKIAKIKSELEELGYSTMMVFVNTSNEVSRQRNIQRGKDGGREVPEDIRLEKWHSVQNARPELEKLFGKENFMAIDNSHDLRKANPDIVKKTKKAFEDIFKRVRKFTAAPAEAEAAKTWTQSEIQKRNMSAYVPARATAFGPGSVRRGPPPEQDLAQPGAAPAPTPADQKVQAAQAQQVSQAASGPSPEEQSQAEMLGLTYYGFGRYGKTIKGKNTVTHISQNGKLVEKVPMVAEMKDPCWKGYQMVGSKKKNGKKVPNCVPVDEAFEDFIAENTPCDREWGKPSLTKIYADMTPGQSQKVIKKKKLPEDNNLPVGTLPVNDGVGPEYGRRANSAVGGIGNIYEWAQSEKTIARYTAKYGENAQKKLDETVKNLSEVFSETNTKPKHFARLREAWEAKGGRDMGSVSNTGKDEVDEDWQKVNRKDKTDGLSQKAVNAYRRENPGSKLQTAVTEKNPEGKRAKRRASFCRRMKGMKSKLTSAKTASDPDSRINKALRRWNCEE